MISIECYGSSSAGNCYRIKSSVNGDELLLDVGLPFKAIQRACKYNFIHLLGALVTHQHGDHAMAVADMLKLGHKIYMLRETADALHVIDEHSWVEISPKKSFKLGVFTVLPFELQHDVPNVGYLITDGEEKLLYITDTYYCKYTFKGVHHIVVECNHSYELLKQRVEQDELSKQRMERLIQSHFALENVIKFLRSMDLSQCKAIHLVHLSNENSNEEYFKKTVQAATGKLVIVHKGKWVNYASKVRCIY